MVTQHLINLLKAQGPQQRTELRRELLMQCAGIDAENVNSKLSNALLALQHQGMVWIDDGGFFCLMDF